MKLSDILKQYREENSISQREFAKRCELSHSLISILEKGYNPQTGNSVDPDSRTYRRLAAGMGITEQKLRNLLQRDNPPPTFAADGNNSDHEILEALHQNPRLGLLFDRSRKMSSADVDFMLQMADRILKERDVDD